MVIPAVLATAWRHCGLYVRGIWVHQGLNERSSTHAHLWQACLVQRGSLRCLTAVGHHELSANDLILTAPGQAARWSPHDDVDLLEILFSAIPEPGHRVPWSLMRLPAVIHGVQGSAPARLARRDQQSRWSDDDTAMTARFVVDRFLWRAVTQGYANGDLHQATLRPAWLHDTIMAADTAIRDPAFDVGALVRLAGCSHAHLCRSIRRYEDTTPSGLIRRLRVERAAQMLGHEPEAPIADIVARCGFGSADRFRRQWRAEGLRSLRSVRRDAGG